jgi:hypothetical protein
VNPNARKKNAQQMPDNRLLRTDDAQCSPGAKQQERHQAADMQMLHDERVGWARPQEGSPVQSFQGSPTAVMTIIDDVDRLTLLIEPAQQRSMSWHDGAVISTESERLGPLRIS